MKKSQYIIRFESEDQRNRYHKNIKTKGWKDTNSFNQVLADNKKLVPKNPLKNVN
jgi:hypothetical protein